MPVLRKGGPITFYEVARCAWEAGSNARNSTTNSEL
jgi:hypothetical protein